MGKLSEIATAGWKEEAEKYAKKGQELMDVLLSSPMEEYLINRLAEMEEAEKTAWAQLNFLLGRKEEVKALLAQLQAPPAATGVKEGTIHE